MIKKHYPKIEVDNIVDLFRDDDNKQSTTNTFNDNVKLPAYERNHASLPADKTLRTRDFLAYQDVEFIHLAYQGLLKRLPDESGLDSWLQELRTGRRNRVEILGRMRLSEEGKKHGVRVKGLWPSFVSHSAARIPVVGYFWRWGKALLRLPLVVKNMERFQTHQAAQQTLMEDNLEKLRNATQDILKDMTGRLDDFQQVILADRSEMGKLTEQMNYVANIKELHAIERELRQSLEQKADLSNTEGLRSVEQLRQELDQISQKIEQKADVEIYEWLHSTQKILKYITEQMNETQQSLREDRREINKLYNSINYAASEHKVALGQVEEKTDWLRLEFEDSLDNLKYITERMNETQQSQLNDREELNKLYNSMDHSANQYKATLNQLEEKTNRLRAEFEVNLNSYRREILNQVQELRSQTLDSSNVASSGETIQESDHQPSESTHNEEEAHLLYSLCKSYQDGSPRTREEIQNDLNQYLQVVSEVNAGTADSIVLDLGCGQGEWLELLKQKNLIARGIDVNQLAVETCRTLDLDVVEADILDYLKSLETNSVGAISAIHVLECLPINKITAVLTQVLRILKTDGVAIFENLNPENVIVNATSHYNKNHDTNLLSPSTLQFLISTTGFMRSKVIRLNESQSRPLSMEFSKDGGGLSSASAFKNLAQQFFFAEPNYVLICYK